MLFNWGFSMMLTKHQKEVLNLLKGLDSEGEKRIQLVCSYLNYHLVKNPVNPESPWLMMEHPDFSNGSQAIIAAYPDDELDKNTTVRELRKKFALVQDLQKEISISYNVPISMLVGHQRLVIFRTQGGNRDDRLDLSLESVQKVGLYSTYFIECLHKDYVQLEDDEFGFGYIINGLENLFQRTLSTRFNYIVELYRRKLAEVIVSDKIFRSPLKQLVTEDAKKLITTSKIEEMIEHPSFKAAVGCVVDTIVLRTLLRRFLEGYHGISPFTSKLTLENLGFGFGEGTLEDVLNRLVEVAHPKVTDEDLKRAVQHHSEPKQLQLFDEVEEYVTAQVNLRDSNEVFTEAYEHLRKQFELAYGGDLFAGDVARATNEIESLISFSHPKLLAKLWADTSTEQFNFRYEDLPPDLLQHQYEASMSRTVQLKINQDGKVTVFYGEDTQEQKTKGAYYTSNTLVKYMVNNSVHTAFQERIQALREALNNEDEKKARLALVALKQLRIADITCGGGSFLRGAFHYLANSREQIVRLLSLYQELGLRLQESEPCFKAGDLGQIEWERHILLNMLFGIDIDYKALIISSQTLTLTALQNWQPGDNFPRLIGLTLIHQNALISPISFYEHTDFFDLNKKKIAEIIKLRNKARQGDSKAYQKSVELQAQLQHDLRSNIPVKLREFAETLNIQSIEINIPEVFFKENGQSKISPGFDVIIGNPPWEAWKYDPDEFFGRLSEQYLQVRKQGKLKIEEDLKRKIPSLVEREEITKKRYACVTEYFLRSNHYKYQNWIINGAKTRGGANLYKASLERAYQLANDGAFVSLVLSASLGGDQGSTGLRHLLLETVTLKEYLGFINTEELFKGVASGEKFAVVTFQNIKPDPSNSFNSFFGKKQIEDANNPSLKYKYPVELAKKIAPDTWALMEAGSKEEFEFLYKLHRFPLISDKRHPLLFRREFNTSDDSHLFNPDYEIPVFEGKDIEQFGINSNYTAVSKEDYDKFWFSKEVKRGLMGIAAQFNLKVSDLKKKYPSIQELIEHVVKPPADFYRLAYREVSYSTNKRTLISTILPINTVSVHTIYLTTPYSIKLDTDKNIVTLEEHISINEMLYYCGLFNTFVLDYIIRKKVKRHVSVYIMNELSVPVYSETNPMHNQIVNLVAQLFTNNKVYRPLLERINFNMNNVIGIEERSKIRSQLDAIIAILYGLNREELINILNTFKKGHTAEELQGVITAFDELYEKGVII